MLLHKRHRARRYREIGEYYAEQLRWVPLLVGLFLRVAWMWHGAWHHKGRAGTSGRADGLHVTLWAMHSRGSSTNSLWSLTGTNHAFDAYELHVSMDHPLPIAIILIGTHVK